MNHALLTKLLLNTPPPHFAILDKLLDIFSCQSYLNSAYIRGSIATNRYDRASDVDLVMVINDSDYLAVVENLNIILSQHFVTLRPGWLDKIVPDFGGLGFVFLVADMNSNYQLDLYLMPLSAKNNLKKIPKVTLVFESPQDSIIAPMDEKVTGSDSKISSYIKHRKSQAASFEEVCDEFLIITYLIKKRIKRQQFFLNSSETTLQWNSLRQMMRHLWEPQYLNYGWYHFLETTDLPTSILDIKNRFQNLMQKHSVSNSESLRLSHQLFLDLVSMSSISSITENSIKAASLCILRELND